MPTRGKRAGLQTHNTELPPAALRTGDAPQDFATSKLQSEIFCKRSGDASSPQTSLIKSVTKRPTTLSGRRCCALVFAKIGALEGRHLDVVRRNRDVGRAASVRAASGRWGLLRW